MLQEAGWASGPVWTGAENLAPPGLDPRTVQPVGSRYTDYATRPTGHYSIRTNMSFSFRKYQHGKVRVALSAMPHGIYQRRVRDTSTSFFLKVVLIYVRLIHVVRYVHYKVKVKVKFTLEQATKAQRGSRVILYSFFNLDARWGWVVNATARLLYPRERRGTHCTCTGRLCLGNGTDCRLLYWVDDVYKPLTDYGSCDHFALGCAVTL